MVGEVPSHPLASADAAVIVHAGDIWLDAHWVSHAHWSDDTHSLTCHNCGGTGMGKTLHDARVDMPTRCQRR